MLRRHEAPVRLLMLLAACAYDTRGPCAEPPANPAATAAPIAEPAPPAEPQAVQQPPAGEAAAAPAAASLDLSALEQRLRDTRAIGLFTKLSLKNQVDDLLAQFRVMRTRGIQMSAALRGGHLDDSQKQLFYLGKIGWHRKSPGLGSPI